MSDKEDGKVRKKHGDGKSMIVFHLISGVCEPGIWSKCNFIGKISVNETMDPVL